MRTACAVAFTGFLIASASSAAAQDAPRTVSNLTESVRREALRISADVPTQPRPVDREGRGKAKWSRVRDVEPGTQIAVTVSDGRGGRIFVAADDSSATVLNLSAGVFSNDAEEVLIDTASDNPEYFLRAERGETFRLTKKAQLTPNGLFIENRKVADLQQVVEHIPRALIEEISTTSRATRRGTLIGTLVGAMLAVVLDGDGQYFPYTALFAGGIGSGIGAGGGAAFKQRNIVYRAPAPAAASSVPPAAR